MGTSSSYQGPKGKNPILPNDSEDNNTTSDNPDNQHEEQPEKFEKNPNVDLWKNAKTQISKLIKDPNRNTKSALSSYVTAYGGASKAAMSATSGKSTTVKLGGFLSDIALKGIQNTLSQYNIIFKGKKVKEVLSDLANRIAPVPETKEDSIARNAIIDTIEGLYDDINENEGDLEILNNMDENAFNKIMRTYISSYIFQRFLNDLESRFEKYSQNEDSALMLEKEIKDYISGVVDNKLKEHNFSEIDYSSDSIMKSINRIYDDCYEVIEDAL